MASIKNETLNGIQAKISEATLRIPDDTVMQSGGKSGRHTEHMGFILTELQYLQRAYPGCEW